MGAYRPVVRYLTYHHHRGEAPSTSFFQFDNRPNRRRSAADKRAVPSRRFIDPAPGKSRTTQRGPGRHESLPAPSSALEVRLRGIRYIPVPGSHHGYHHLYRLLQGAGHAGGWLFSVSDSAGRPTAQLPEEAQHCDQESRQVSCPASAYPRGPG